MKKNIGISAMAFALAITTPAFSSDWYRSTLAAPIFFSGASTDVTINVDDEPSSRIYGEIIIPVSVDGVSIDDAINVIGLPSGATWTPTSFNTGTVTWTGALSGAYNFVVEVRDVENQIVASQGVELTVFEELSASVPETEYEVDQGAPLTITPLAENAIGTTSWGLSETHAWLNVNSLTGVIDVDTSQANSVEDIFLTAADSFDNATAETALFSIAVNSGIGEHWITTINSQRHGHNNARDVKVGPDGSIYIVGQLETPESWTSDFFIAKYSPEGQALWQRTLSGAEGTNRGRSLAIAPNGDVYATGRIAHGGTADLLVVKYNSNGDLDWYRTYGGSGSEEGTGIELAADGSIYVGGTTNTYGNGNYDFLVVKLDNNGQIVWQRTVGGTSADTAHGITVDSTDSVYIYGESTSSPTAGNKDILLAKYTSNGTLSWTRMIGGAANDNIKGAVHYGGHLYMVGYTAQNAAVNSGEVVLIKLPDNGTLSSATRSLLGSSLNEDGVGIASDGAGSIYLTGYTTTAENGRDAFVAKYSSDFAATSWQWKKNLAGSHEDIGNAIAVGNGYVYMAGETKSYGEHGASGFSGVLLAKLPIDNVGVMESENASWSNSAMITSGITLNGQSVSWVNNVPGLEVSLDNTGLVSGDEIASQIEIETLE